jgi:hypothetical protein
MVRRAFTARYGGRWGGGRAAGEGGGGGWSTAERFKDLVGEGPAHPRAVGGLLARRRGTVADGKCGVVTSQGGVLLSSQLLQQNLDHFLLSFFHGLHSNAARKATS